MIDLPTYLVLAAVSCASALVMSLAGFGFGLVAMSFFPLFLDVAESNVVASLLALPVIVVNVIPIRSYLKPRVLVPVLIATAFGTPVGIWGLARLDEGVLLAGLGSLILVSLVVSEVNGRRRDRRPVGAPKRAAAIAAGALGGMFGGAYSISGPPVLLYMTTAFFDKHELKANIMFYFLLQISFRFIFLVAGGIATMNLVATAGALLLPMALGVAAGMVLFNRVNSLLVRRITQVLLALSSIMLIIKAI